MGYPNFNKIHKTIAALKDHSHLKYEEGNEDFKFILHDLEYYLDLSLNKIKCLPVNRDLQRKEPNDLVSIKQLRPKAISHKLWSEFNVSQYRDKLEGAILSRFAGCILGAIVEFWPIEEMEEWSHYLREDFPPVDYWPEIKNPVELRYGKNQKFCYCRDKINGVPVDDDIVYTLLGLLIMEEHGADFSTEDVAKSWLKYLPYACTAEEVALNNLQSGISSMDAAEVNNPYNQWIGALIRSDPWAYFAPGNPELAAEYAYRDAYLSHRRNGIYGEMLFAAAQSAAFAVDNPIDAIKIGLNEIPKDCILANEVRWALNSGTEIKNHKDARLAVDLRFKGMEAAHTMNNTCLIIFGLMIGELDVTKVLSEIVAMGLDNDCTAATAGSIVGAIVGKAGIPEHWYRNFNNKVYTYLKGHDEFKIDDIISRFVRQTEKRCNL